MMPFVALLAAPYRTNKQQSSLPTIAFRSTSMYITSAQSSPFASSAADSFVGTTTLPAPQVHSYNEWEDEREDEYAATPASPRRALGDPHSGGTSIQTPGAKIGDGVGVILVLAFAYIVFRCRKTIWQKLARIYRVIQRNVFAHAKSNIRTT
jgi:hypothetical protein